MADSSLASRCIVLAEQVKAGAERLDYYQQLEREHIHLLLIDDAAKGLDDVAAGGVQDARASLQAFQRRRAAPSAGRAVEAEGPVSVKTSVSFERRLGAVERLLLDAQAPQAFDALLPAVEKDAKLH